MSSYTPQTDLSLERSRLIGIILGGVSYGVYLLLTVQAVTALMQRPRRGQKIANNRRMLLCYTLITFALSTICFACSTKYTEVIWITLRDAPGGPVALIENSMHYRINFVAILCGYVAEWFMQALLLYRCFVLWDWARHVMIPMFVVYIGMIAAAIVVLVQAGTGASFYTINATLAYLAFLVANTVLYTILVAKRLLSIRSEMKTALAEYDSSIYDTIILMVVESAMAYTVFVIIFIVAFAVHSDTVSTLCFLSIYQVQGITQLFIIIRVARGRAVTHAWSTRNAPAAPTTLAFAGTTSEGTNATTPEQDSASESCSVSAKSAEANV
ncbi:uncharacterized protein F5891DRAFT_1102582 [Suillus fuscotomentosus]|uniref:Uncharacterized protein n=1 Tax=Suillus fuscotomentosus TaxID=1912939 RepID=A0AAD4EFI2_9AGAM|nr:uncharacterized protein F5891DRAFT_1150010 [Suillus fuscotomentosus]XP_041230755.1 uncharacterized protein F5891DRAFT_1102582 [Suillus fuscotomentosus]KAG1896846.1 hypothetical protein F5891DRAFT_1150010 [Suillus fuscotomentosus]KAG1905180.1 hypothetical protein F5891DRAFT_1102582 [Suillus fuscotomentosus]